MVEMAQDLGKILNHCWVLDKFIGEIKNIKSDMVNTRLLLRFNDHISQLETILANNSQLSDSSIPSDNDRIYTHEDEVVPSFETKTAEMKYYTDLKNKIRICSSIKKSCPEKFPILMALCQRHPDKIKIDGITDLAIVTNPYRPSCLELNIIKDTHQEDISLYTCVYGEPKSSDSMLSSALRYCIEDQIRDFRLKNRCVCKLCGTRSGKFEVDHIVHFDKIKFDFLKLQQKSSIPTEFDGDRKSIFMLKDKLFGDKFKKYHQQHVVDACQLRILCTKCNRSRPKYEKPGRHTKPKVK